MSTHDVALEAAKKAIRSDRQQHAEIPYRVEEILDEAPATLNAAGAMIDALARRLLDLEERLASEVRTRRLVVVDAAGHERAIIECRASDPLEMADSADFVHLDLLAVESAGGANATARLYAGTSSTMIGKGRAKRRREHGSASVGAESTAEGRRAFASVGAVWSPPAAGMVPETEHATGTLNLCDTSAGVGIHDYPSLRRVREGQPAWPVQP